MANVTAITNLPVTIAVANTAEASVTLDPQRSYLLQHNGLAAAGSADTNTIFLSFDATVDNDVSAEEDKFLLINVQPIVVGPGVSNLNYRSAAGVPTFSVMPGPHEFGDF